MQHAIATFCFAKGRLPGDFVGGSPVMSNRGTFPIPMIYSAIVPCVRSPEGRDVLLVDTGFRGGKSMTGRTFEDFETPDQTLAKIGLTRRDVGTVVLTHMHFDHAGNLDAFPEATVWLQGREYEEWRHVLSRPGLAASGKEAWALSSINRADFDTLERIRAEGRLRLADGDHSPVAGVACRLAADTHTFGSQWILVDTPGGPRVLAGDCAYWYANIERMWPPGYIQGNPWAMLEAYDRMLEAVGGELDRIVVGHDMEIFTRQRSFVAGANPVAVPWGPWNGPGAG